MKKIYLLSIALLMLAGSYAQSVKKFVTFTNAGFRAASTQWEWQSLNLDQGVVITFYCNQGTDVKSYIDYIKISNGYGDFFELPYTGVVNKNGGIDYISKDKDGVTVKLELINRGGEGANNYLELYIRYTNIEYNYKFKRQVSNL